LRRSSGAGGRLGKLWISGRDHIERESIVLPLSPDGTSVNMLLGGAIFTRGPVQGSKP
jgi:hypothetical protein